MRIVRCALAVADAMLAPQLDKKDDLIRFLILDVLDVPILKPFGFGQSQACIDRKQDVVVQLFSMPLIPLIAVPSGALALTV